MAAKRRQLQGTLLDVFLRWGFQEVVTPTFVDAVLRQSRQTKC